MKNKETIDVYTEMKKLSKRLDDAFYGAHRNYDVTAHLNSMKQCLDSITIKLKNAIINKEPEKGELKDFSLETTANGKSCSVYLVFAGYRREGDCTCVICSDGCVPIHQTKRGVIPYTEYTAESLEQKIEEEFGLSVKATYIREE